MWAIELSGLAFLFLGVPAIALSVWLHFADKKDQGMVGKGV
jgi:hypothetical protein